MESLHAPSFLDRFINTHASYIPPPEVVLLLLFRSCRCFLALGSYLLVLTAEPSLSFPPSFLFFPACSSLALPLSLRPLILSVTQEHSGGDAGHVWPSFFAKAASLPRATPARTQQFDGKPTTAECRAFTPAARPGLQAFSRHVGLCWPSHLLLGGRMYKDTVRFEGQEKEDDSTGLRTQIAVEAVTHVRRSCGS